MRLSSARGAGKISRKAGKGKVKDKAKQKGFKNFFICSGFLLD
jgi:hypothetical protein